MFYSEISAPSRRLILQVLAGVPAALLALPDFGEAANLAEIKRRGYLTVASEDDFQPFEFVKNGKPTGYDVELLKAIETSLPFKVHQDMIPWTGILPGVVTGKYDAAVTAVLVTPERLKMLDFTSPVAESVDYYIKRTRDKRIGGIKDLSGLTLGVEAGSAMLKLLPQLGAMLAKTGGKLGRIVQYQDYPSAYQDLASGRLDYVVNTHLNLNSIVKARPGVFAMGQPVSKPVYIAWAMKKGSTNLLAVFNKALAKAREDGSMYALQKKWFNTSFTSMPITPAA